jgi:hypothetical protein
VSKAVRTQISSEASQRGDKLEHVVFGRSTTDGANHLVGLFGDVRMRDGSADTADLCRKVDPGGKLTDTTNQTWE